MIPRFAYYSGPSKRRFEKYHWKYVTPFGSLTSVRDALWSDSVLKQVTCFYRHYEKLLYNVVSLLENTFPVGLLQLCVSQRYRLYRVNKVVERIHPSFAGRGWMLYSKSCLLVGYMDWLSKTRRISGVWYHRHHSLVENECDDGTSAPAHALGGEYF